MTEEKTLFATKSNEGRFHPLVTFLLMFLANNGALLVFLHMLFGRFSLFGLVVLVFLLASSVLLYTTS